MSKEIKVDVLALAKLARLEISASEVLKLEREIPDILEFVDQIQSVATHTGEESAELRNVMRDDAGAHEGGLYSKDLLAAAPATKGGRVVVKQVVSRKRRSS